MHGLDLPDWVLKVSVVALGLGFPAVAVLAWGLALRAAVAVEGGAEAAVGSATENPPEPAGPARVRPWHAVLLVGTGLLVAAPGVTWYLVFRHRPTTSAPAVSVSAATTAPSAASPAAEVGPAVAVLPFANLTGDPGQDYLAEGVAEEVRSALAKLRGLRVTGRTSSQAFRAKAVDLREIGGRLGVGAVLEGSVRRAGNRVRIGAQLVQVADGFHLWSETFERALDDVFAVQEEIAEAVARALAVKLLPERSGPAGAPRPSSPEAYDLYLLGRDLNRRGSSEAVRRSQEALERATALDPRYAPAWSALASTYVNRAGSTASADEAETFRRRAWDAVQRAVALAPGWADGYRVRGNTRARDRWDWAGAREDFDRALALAPGDFAVIADRALSLLAPAGRVTEAARELRRALALEPLSSTLWSTLCWLELHDDHPADARAACGRALELSPENGYARASLVELALGEQRTTEALAAARALADEEARAVYLAVALHAAGQRGPADAALAELERRFGADAPYDVARVHAFRGDADGAFTWLEKALAQRDPDLCSVRVELGHRLGGDRRWAGLLERMGLGAAR